MALTGLALVLFVLGHVLGNLQIYLGASFINEYAYHLHSLPAVVMWAVRLSLLAIAAVHIWAAVSLTIDNRRARPEAYAAKANVQKSFASGAMRWTGVVLAIFIVFHIFHFTVRNLPGSHYEDQIADVALVKHGEDVYNGAEKVMVFNVNDMMVEGFQVWWVSAFYILAVALLSIHLSHGVSSMFQSLGLRNKVWRKRLDRIAVAYAVVVFLGFASIPVGVLAGVLKQSNPEGNAAKVAAEAVPAAVVDVNIQK
jgi:succinate dehydrogenase / fumarate reductase cytochrome b subunit